MWAVAVAELNEGMYVMLMLWVSCVPTFSKDGVLQGMHVRWKGFRYQLKRRRVVEFSNFCFIDTVG